MKDLQTRVQSYLPQEKLQAIQAAYEFALTAHEGQRRLSGGPYVEHPIQTALYLADLKLDATTLMAALLHDVMEDCNVTHQELTRRFGPEVAGLVDGVTKLSKLDMMATEDREGLRHSGEDGHAQAENLRKMLVSMAKDIRVVLIKLADRMHNMRTLRALPLARRVAIAQETLDIYAPLAHRLGMWDMKWRLEDIAFRHLQPDKYREISRLLASKRDQREEYIQQVTSMLKRELDGAGIKEEITGRPKHLYSIFKKIERYAALGKEFRDIYDLFAFRVLVKEVQDCYAALGVIHALWHPIPGQFDDYIANPKENMYQSLHTTVMCIGGVPIEIQIRTFKMHEISQDGVAAHWRYKESGVGDMHFDEKMTWMRQLLEWQREAGGAEEFLESVKTDIFHTQVFVYTPKGDVKELPLGSTPIDLAYRLHTDLGHRCIGAKVNGKLVPLDYQLQNGDTVEILTTKLARGPSLDWLNPNLAYVRSANARAAIRQWFRRQAREPNVQRGRELLHKELRHLNLSMSEEEVALLLKYENTEEFLAALGSGGISIAKVMARLTAQQEKAQEGVYSIPVPAMGPASGIQVLGVGDLLTSMAQCCEPLPGDEIVGFITRTRGVTIHRKDCPNIANEDAHDRVVKVDWGQTRQLYPVRLAIVSWDRVGLLRDITTIVSEEGVNIASVVTTEQEDGTASIDLTLFITSMEQLSLLFARVEAVQGVISATRSSPVQGKAAQQESGKKA